MFDETTDPLLVSWRLAKFYAHESCGKCTPCREGSGWIEKVLYRMLHGQGRPDDLDLLLSFGNNIVPGLNAPFAQTTICALGTERDEPRREPRPVLPRRDRRTPDRDAARTEQIAASGLTVVDGARA